MLVKQGPDLIGVVGRRAGTGLSFNYTKALQASGIVWDAATLDQFLTSLMTDVPGTTMPIPVTDVVARHNIIAYLSKLVIPAGVSLTGVSDLSSKTDPNDWRHAAPGASHHFMVTDLPAPYSTVSVGNAPQIVEKPDNATLSVPPGFTVKLFASGLSGPRLLRVAPNGDIFIAEMRANRIRVMRAADGADAPSENQVFAGGLDRPFGIAFYPPGNVPQWIYVANNNSVVRFPYRSGDLTARGDAEVIVPRLCYSSGGHSTRDVAFSRDGRRMFISVGSGSNVAEEMSKNPSRMPNFGRLNTAWARLGVPKRIALTSS